ncbi:MAG: TolC family protein [Candidatus Bipolaricaulota bacterium]|nr:TolC family protein [Candidatus Bipolaricaulota bacterium]MDW8030242.1 TolC family protein [Candidatus Bipolaricaulota bacterium]
MKRVFFTVILGTLCVVSAQAQSVSEIIQQIAQRAPVILQAQDDIAAAERELKLFRQSIWMPQLTVSALPIGFSGGSWQGSLTFSANMSLPLGTTLRFSYTGTISYADGSFRGSLTGEVTQPVFGFRLTDATLELDRRQVALEEAKHALAERQRQVMLDALSELLDLTIVRESIAIAQARVELAKKLVDAVRSRVQSGQAEQTELLAAQIELRQSELTLAKLQRDFALAQERFLITYGIDEMPTWQAPTVRAELKDLAEVLLHIEITPEVVFKDARVRRAMQQLGERFTTKLKVQYNALPKVGLTVSYEPHSAGWSIGLGVHLSFLADHALKLERAHQAFAAAQQALSSTAKTVKLELLTQRNALHEAYSQLDVLALRSELMALQHEMKHQQLERGLLSPLDWEAFLLEQREFENERRAALYKLAIAYLRYKNSWGLSFSLQEAFHE